MGACIFPVLHSPGQRVGPWGPSSYVNCESHFSSPRTMCKWWCSCFPCCPCCPGSTFSGGWATWQMPTGAATKMEKHKTENASMQMPVTWLRDTINGLQSDETPYHFIACGCKQGQGFLRARFYSQRPFTLQTEAKGHPLHSDAA